jgi:hypothetical protein
MQLKRHSYNSPAAGICVDSCGYRSGVVGESHVAYMIRRAPEIDVGNIAAESAGKQEVMVVGPLIQEMYKTA